MAGKRYAKKADKRNMYEETLRNLVTIMDKGTLPWSKGRLEGLGSPSPANFNTGKRYKGFNVINLLCISMENDFKSNFFITYNQALNVAGLNRKDKDLIEKSPLSGQKSVGHVTYWGCLTKDADGKPWFVIENGKKRTMPTPQEVKDEKLKQNWFLRDTAIFGFEQLDQEKIPQAWLEKRNMAEKTINKDMLNNQNDDVIIATAVKKMIDRLGVKVEHSPMTKTPCFKPSLDKICMPPKNMYEDNARYYHTLFHELTHATGASHRLDRESLRDYGMSDEVRAYEELVAELGGVFMAIELGTKPITIDNLQNHASYIKSWHSLLADNLNNGDCKILHKACSEAEKAVSFLLDGPELNNQKKMKVVKENDDNGLTP